MPRTTPRVVQFFQRHQHWFKATDKAIQTLFAARGGGPLVKLLAGFSAVGTTIETMYPQDSGWLIMRRAGLVDANLTVGGYLCDLLLTGYTPEVVAMSQWGTVTFLWRDEKGQPFAGAMYNGSKFSDGPFLPRDGEEAFYAAIRKTVWSRSTELQFTTTKTDEHVWRGAGRFHVEPMNPLGPFISKKRPEWFAERLSKYPKGEPLTVRFRGPTGAGKTVLARHLARHLRPGASRTLKISSEVLKKCRSDEVRGIIRCLQPTVLILDDLNLNENNEFLLDLLESLRDPNTLTVITEMTKFADKEEPKPGSWHTPGGRPGRVDETYYFAPPDEEERGWILDHYATLRDFRLKPKLRAKLVAATEGLTGAYIGRILIRLATHGTKDWRHEVDQVLYTAPFETKEEKKGDGAAPSNSEAPATKATA